jgi:hypothetical protein
MTIKINVTSQEMARVRKAMAKCGLDKRESIRLIRNVAQSHVRKIYEKTVATLAIFPSRKAAELAAKAALENPSGFDSKEWCVAVAYRHGKGIRSTCYCTPAAMEWVYNHPGQSPARKCPGMEQPKAA